MSRGFVISNPKDSKKILTVYTKDSDGNRKKHLTLRPGETKTVVKSPVYIEDRPETIKLVLGSDGYTKDSAIVSIGGLKRARLKPSEAI